MFEKRMGDISGAEPSTPTASGQSASLRLRNPHAYYVKSVEREPHFHLYCASNYNQVCRLD